MSHIDSNFREREALVLDLREYLAAHAPVCPDDWYIEETPLRSMPFAPQEIQKYVREWRDDEQGRPLEYFIPSPLKLVADDWMVKREEIMVYNAQVEKFRPIVRLARWAVMYADAVIQELESH